MKCSRNIGASPSGKAAGFGPAISEVRILPPQNKKIPTAEWVFFCFGRDDENVMFESRE